MIFEEIVLDNFGIYKGRHNINLIPEVDPKKRKPIILFGALNGSGKTTLVDALQLVLYGNSASQSNRGNLAYPNYLESLINKNADPKEGAAIEITMRIQRHQRDENIKLNRSWKKNGQGIKESFEVSRDGQVDTFATEHWDEVVEEIIPRGIAHLFFFDGERIEQLADTDNAAKIIETGLHTLLGLDLVDRLMSDLTFVERRRKKTLLSKTESEKVEQKESEINILQQESEKACQKHASENNKLELSNKKLRLLQNQYRKSGGKLLDSRKTLEIELKIIEERLGSVFHHLKEIASKSTPLLLVRCLLDKVRDQVEQEEELKQINEISKILKNRDRLIVEYIKSQNKSEEFASSVSEYLKSDRRGRLKKEKLETYLEVSNKEFNHVSNNELQDVLIDIKELLNTAAKINKEIHKINKSLSAVPSEEQLSELIKHIDNSTQENKKQLKNVEKLDNQYQFAREKLDKKRRELEHLLEQELKIDIANEKNTRVIRHTKKIHETLKKFRRAVAEKHIHVLENLILESFQQIIRKSNLVSKIKIEAETFRLNLIDNNGKSLDAKKLSAGERQLLAIAILWGLAKASGRPLPTIIDTPLGRLDTKHRDNLIKYYFPSASHQVILLSTDTEIIDDYYKELKPAVKRAYQIDFDEQTGSSHITPGYFS